MFKSLDDFYATLWASIAVSSLFLDTLYGSKSTLIFLVSGIVFVASNLTSSFKSCRANWVVFLIPCWALLSSAWSDISLVAARGSLQLILTTLFAVVIASRVDFKILLNSMGIAMLIAMLACLNSSNVALDGLTGEYNLIGIFSSKNYLAAHTAMSICVALTLVFNQKTDVTCRLFGAVLLITSTLVLIKANSVGAFAFILLAIVSTVFIVFYQNLKLHASTRHKFNWGITIVTLTVFALLITNFILGEFDVLIYSIDKDPTLTGRTGIWEFGYNIITDNPMLGVGFQSLFYIGNPIAEDIWDFAHVPSGAGFNFHNMLVDITVSLGFIGLGIFLFWLTKFFYRILAFKKIVYGSEQFFSILVFSFMFWQISLEASWLQQFTVIHLFICFAWVFLGNKKSKG